MSMNLVNLNVNPCKMCMPMGSVTALFGIRHSMSILHGSQGCATYIRRHMATHYNEPIDVASSALTEQGTVFGGADNLLKGIKNVIKVYNPEIIEIVHIEQTIFYQKFFQSQFFRYNFQFLFLWLSSKKHYTF